MTLHNKKKMYVPELRTTYEGPLNGTVDTIGIMMDIDKRVGSTVFLTNNLANTGLSAFVNYIRTTSAPPSFGANNLRMFTMQETNFVVCLDHYSPEHICLAHICTVHKRQSAEAPYAVFALGDAESHLRFGHLYTSCSRAKLQAIVLAPRDNCGVGDIGKLVRDLITNPNYRSTPIGISKEMPSFEEIASGHI